MNFPPLVEEDLTIGTQMKICFHLSLVIRFKNCLGAKFLHKSSSIKAFVIHYMHSNTQTIQPIKIYDRHPKVGVNASTMALLKLYQATALQISAITVHIHTKRISNKQCNTVEVIQH